MEVYIDDMIIKSRKVEDHVGDIMVVFYILDRARMKLNLKKCTSRVKAGKFLGFMAFERGIEANPKKIKAILDMQPPNQLRKYRG